MQDELENENCDRMFFEFVARAYDSYMLSDDANDQQLENDLANAFRKTPTERAQAPRMRGNLLHAHPSVSQHFFTHYFAL